MTLTHSKITSDCNCRVRRLIRTLPYAAIQAQAG